MRRLMRWLCSVGICWWKYPRINNPYYRECRFCKRKQWQYIYGNGFRRWED